MGAEEPALVPTAEAGKTYERAGEAEESTGESSRERNVAE